MPGDDPLALLRCERGCSTSFLQYLTWEGTALQICESRRTFSRTGGNQTVYDIGVRCADCGLRARHTDIPHAVKAAFDSMLRGLDHELQDLADEQDTDVLTERLFGTARLMEENPGE